MLTGIKIAALQLAAFIGLIAGAFIAPAPLIYPIAPSEAEYAVIGYRELHIFFLMGCLSGIAAFGMGRILRLSFGLCFGAAIFAVIMFGGLEGIRQGVLISTSVPQFGIYLAAVFSAFGLYQAAELTLRALRPKPEPSA